MTAVTAVTLNSIIDICMSLQRITEVFAEEKTLSYYQVSVGLVTLLITSRIRCYITSLFLDFMNKKNIAYRTKSDLFAK